MTARFDRMLGSVIVYPRVDDDGPYLDLVCPGCKVTVATHLGPEAVMVLVGTSTHKCEAIDSVYLNDLLSDRYGGYTFRDWRTGLDYVRPEAEEQAA